MQHNVMVAQRHEKGHWEDFDTLAQELQPYLQPVNAEQTGAWVTVRRPAASPQQAHCVADTNRHATVGSVKAATRQSPFAADTTQTATVGSAGATTQQAHSAATSRQNATAGAGEPVRVYKAGSLQPSELSLQTAELLQQSRGDATPLARKDCDAMGQTNSFAWRQVPGVAQQQTAAVHGKIANAQSDVQSQMQALSAKQIVSSSVEEARSQAQPQMQRLTDTQMPSRCKHTANNGAIDVPAEMPDWLHSSFKTEASDCLTQLDMSGQLQASQSEPVQATDGRACRDDFHSISVQGPADSEEEDQLQKSRQLQQAISSRTKRISSNSSVIQSHASGQGQEGSQLQMVHQQEQGSSTHISCSTSQSSRPQAGASRQGQAEFQLQLLHQQERVGSSHMSCSTSQSSRAQGGAGSQGQAEYQLRMPSHQELEGAGRMDLLHAVRCWGGFTAVADRLKVLPNTR